VGVELPGEPIDERLKELEALALTAGVPAVAEIVQRRSRPDPSSYIGRGKVAEVREIASGEDADVVIFDHALSPAQARNLEEALGRKVVDRSQLILDIFAQRASTKESKLQVELAQLTYLLPRLRGWGMALTRLGGGIGTRGPGETQLELDRNKVMRRIHALERQLRKARGERALRRRRRVRANLPRVALVGYTNSGKSTLLNRLAKSSGLVEDKLFATLTPFVRRADLEGGRTILLIDTVGFVQALPHELVPAFASTLEAAREADLILHVIDAASPTALAQRDVVVETLSEAVFDGAAMPPRLDVWNKSDLVSSGALELPLECDAGVLISAREGDGIEELQSRILTLLDRHSTEEGTWLVPFTATSLVYELRRHHEITVEAHTPDGMRVTGRLPSAQWIRLHSSGAIPLEEASPRA
jgi:GTP-binding protein HflX